MVGVSSMVTGVFVEVKVGVRNVEVGVVVCVEVKVPGGKVGELVAVTRTVTGWVTVTGEEGPVELFEQAMGITDPIMKM